MSGLTCLVTVHGIGFQQPPVAADGRAGYADRLHRLLHESEVLPGLGDDPERLPGAAGPVYVQRPWREVGNGLGRLADGRALVDGPVGDGRVAHVAVVYSGLELGGHRLGSALDTLARAVHGMRDYVHLQGAVRLLAADLRAISQHPSSPAGPAAGGLRPRADLPAAGGHPAGGATPAPAVADHVGRLLDRLHPAGPGAHPTEPAGRTAAPAAWTDVVSTLEHDVASYVCRNDLRERLRGFVQDVLARLDGRDDVARIVVNSHSQGTVLALDVLARYVPTKLAGLVTAGSPLRKYVDLFAWGDRVGELERVVRPGFWWNFYDERDPVADPLAPDRSWRAGEPLPYPQGATLMRIPHADGSPGTTDCPVSDVRVDNVAHCHGPLAAHNYWDNTAEFVPGLAEFLRRVGATRPAAVAS